MKYGIANIYWLWVRLWKTKMIRKFPIVLVVLCDKASNFKKEGIEGCSGASHYVY